MTIIPPLKSQGIKTKLIEIKPYKQTIIPRKKRFKNLKNFMFAARNYMINSAKWEQAKIYCKKKNIEFQILTEKALNLNNKKY